MNPYRLNEIFKTVALVIMTLAMANYAPAYKLIWAFLGGIWAFDAIRIGFAVLMDKRSRA